MRGGVRVGNGLGISGDLLSNLNPTPYVLPAASVNTLGGVKQGQNISIAADGTISAAAAGGAETSFKPENYGAIRGTGLTQQQRESNTASINSCLTQAAAVKGRVDMGGGTWEIFGPLMVSNTSTMIVQGDWCTVRQFQSSTSILSITNATQIIVRGMILAYQSNQTTGVDAVTSDTYAAALRLNAVTNCQFIDIDTFNAWVHIGLSGGTGSFSNTFTNCRVGMSTGQAWGLVHKTGNGNNFINMRVTGGTTPQTVTGGVYVGTADQVTFTNLVCEFLSASRPLHFFSVRAATVTGGVLNRIAPLATANYGSIVSGASGSTIQITGLLVTGATISSTSQSMAESAIFAGEQGCAFLVASMTLSATTREGSSRFSLIGSLSAAPVKNVTGTFQQVRLDTDPVYPHRLDDLAVASIDPTSDTLIGPVLSYNSVVGEVTGSLYTIGDQSLTVFPMVHGRHIQCTAPLTAERTVTLSRNIDRPYASGVYSAPRTVRGATFRLTRTAASTGTPLLTLANHDGSSIVGLAANQSVMVVFDGSNFTMIPGSLTSGGGGGGGAATVTFATTSEAITGTSTTTSMNPARTKEAFTSFANANEMVGTQGQVLGFDASGNAAAVKMTRTVTVPLVAETAAVAAAAKARTIAMPIGMKVTEISVFLVTAGTTATTVDVNVGGTSILNAPISVAANTRTASATSFTTASGGNIALKSVVDFDIDAAGTNAHRCG